MLQTKGYAIVIDRGAASKILLRSRLALQGFHASDDFHDFASNLALSGAVVRLLQITDHVTRVFGCALHCDHPRDLFTDRSIQEAFEQFDLETHGYHFFENALG